MVKDRVRDVYGLGLTMGEKMDRSVVGINITTSKNNCSSIVGKCNEKRQ